MRNFLALSLVIVLLFVASCTQAPAVSNTGPNTAPNASSTDIAATVQAAVAATVQSAVNATIASMAPAPTQPLGTATSQPGNGVVGTPIVQPTSIAQPTSTEVGIGPIITGT